MNYQGYENYMQEVLGYGNMPNNLYNTYTPYNQPNEYYQMQQMRSNTEDLNNMYPEIYKMIYPMVCKICNQNVNRRITSELLEDMVLEIYKNTEETVPTEQVAKTTNLRNGDVRNPNAKEFETKLEKRHDNFLLKDLIRILLLNELRKPSRQPMMPPRPQMPPPPSMGMPSYMMRRILLKNILSIKAIAAYRYLYL